MHVSLLFVLTSLVVFLFLTLTCTGVNITGPNRAPWYRALRKETQEALMTQNLLSWSNWPPVLSATAAGSYLIVPYLVLFLSYLTLPYLALSCLVLSYVVLSCLISPALWWHALGGWSSKARVSRYLFSWKSRRDKTRQDQVNIRRQIQDKTTISCLTALFCSGMDVLGFIDCFSK